MKLYHNTPLRIALDCDGVLADLPNYYLEWLRRNYDGKFREEKDLVNKSWHTGLGVPGHIDEMFFTSVPFQHHVTQITNYKGARKFVDSLKAQGHTVLCLTATASAAWTGQRAEWLERVVGISCKKQVIVGKDEKQYHHSDILVDDDPDNCEAWARRHSDGRALLFDRPWNREHCSSLSNVSRVVTYEEILGLLNP